MDLKKILSISGRPGLYQMNAQTRGGVVATSLLDGKRIVTSPAQQISILGEIQIYCIGKEVASLAAADHIFFWRLNPLGWQAIGQQKHIVRLVFKVINRGDSIDQTGAISR